MDRIGTLDKNLRLDHGRSLNWERGKRVKMWTKECSDRGGRVHELDSGSSDEEPKIHWRPWLVCEDVHSFSEARKN